MPDHRSNGIDLDELLKSVREVADGIVKQRWPAFVPPGAIEEAKEYLAARVRASVARVGDFAEFLNAVADLVREMEQAQREAASAGRWYLAVLRRLDPKYAKALCQEIDCGSAGPAPEPDDEEQTDSDGLGLGELPVREALLLMLALAGKPLLPSEIIDGLSARGKRIDGNDLSLALQDCKASGEIVTVPASPGPGIKLKWALGQRG